MSGIVGILRSDGQPVDQNLLRHMVDFLAFRGPDESGVWSEGNIGLGHRLHRWDRGPISPRQPRTLDGDVWIVADARIDGREGCPDTIADAELILRAYEKWGADCPRHLLGDFTFALWDRPRRRLFCAVDHLGVKPFYFAVVGADLLFGNTLDCLRLHPRISDRLDECAVFDFLVFGYYQDRSRTIFADVRRLLPGHYLICENGRTEQKRYWSLPAPQEERPAPRDRGARCRELLERAVADRLRSPRTGILLSGGIDSPLLAATAKSVVRNANDSSELRGYTVVYDRLFADKERHYANLVGQALDMPIEFHAADDAPLYDWAASGERPPPEPLVTASWGWNIRFLRAIAAECPTLLTGDDGDAPLMASLPRHWLTLLRTGQWLRMAKDLLWYVAHQRRLPPIGLRDRFRNRRRAFDRQQVLPWLTHDFARKIEPAARMWTLPMIGAAKTSRDVAWRYLQSPIWATLFDSYEPGWTGLPLNVCFPYLDIRLLDVFFRLPAVPWCVNKEVLRSSLRAVAPRAVSERRKTVLAGDPTFIKVRAGGRLASAWLCLEPEAEPFLDRLALTKALQSAPAPDACRAALRAVTFNLWLRAQKHRRGRIHASGHEQSGSRSASTGQEKVQGMRSQDLR